MTVGNEHSRLLVEEGEDANRRTPLRYALRFAAAAAAFAVVATVGVVAVHPNGSAVILQTTSLGEAPVASGPGAAPDPDGDPFAGPGPADPGDSAAAHQQAAAAAVQDPTPVIEASSPTGGIAGGFSSIVSETKTKDAAVAEAVTHIETAGSAEELETNVRALATADDKLKAAAAETEKSEAILREKDLEMSNAKSDFEEMQKAASVGGLSDTAQDIAKQNTATLSADKRVYLNTRNTYAASTALVATNKALLQTAKQNSAAAMQAYVEKKAAADAARAKAEEMAAAMVNHNTETKAAPEVGEESTPDGISRSQTMAEISAAATQQDILANDIQTQASLLKQAWDDRLLEQKTAQETLDAEVAREANLAIQSNKEQKDFIDSSHVAAIDATAAADAKKKADADLVEASKRYAAAQVAREAAFKEVKRLTDVQEVRKEEFDAQTAKTDSIRAKSEVMEALSQEADIATKTEQIKDATNRDAIINTISTDLNNKDLAAQNAATASNTAAGIDAANAIAQAAIDEPTPEVVSEVLNTNPTTESNVVAAGDQFASMPQTSAVQAVEASAGPVSSPVAATGEKEDEAKKAKAQHMAKAQQQAKAKQMAEAAKKSAAAARQAKQSAQKKATA